MNISPHNYNVASYDSGFDNYDYLQICFFLLIPTLHDDDLTGGDLVKRNLAAYITSHQHESIFFGITKRLLCFTVNQKNTLTKGDCLTGPSNPDHGGDSNPEIGQYAERVSKPFLRNYLQRQAGWNHKMAPERTYLVGSQYVPRWIFPIDVEIILIQIGLSSLHSHQGLWWRWYIAGCRGLGTIAWQGCCSASSDTTQKLNGRLQHTSGFLSSGSCQANS